MNKTIKCNNCDRCVFVDEIYFIEETKEWYCYDCVLNLAYDDINQQIFHCGYWDAHHNPNISMKENYINIPKIYIKENYKTYRDMFE